MTSLTSVSSAIASVRSSNHRADIEQTSSQYRANIE